MLFPLATHAQNRVIAVAGQAAPQTSAGVNYATFSAMPAIDDLGRVVFSATLTGNVDASNHQGIWQFPTIGDAKLVARTGNQAPGADPGVNFSAFNSEPAISSAGHVAFFGELTGPGVNTTNKAGVWSTSPAGSTQLVSRAGSPAAGTAANTVFSGYFLAPSVDADGTVAFRAGLQGPGVDVTNSLGIWQHASNTTSLVARAGNQAPGLPAGVNYRFAGDPHVLSGSLAYGSFLSGSGVTAANNQAVWGRVGIAGSPTLVARSGDLAPGTEIDTRYIDLLAGNVVPSVNPSGRTAFLGSLIGPSVTANNNAGLWAQTEEGGMTLMARTGESATGLPGLQLASLYPIPPLLNAVDRVAFSGTLTGAGVNATNNEAIWTRTPYESLLIARTGENAPGTSAGVNFSSIQLGSMNDLAQTLLTGSLTGAGVDASNNVGIWATDLLGSLTLIARTGSLVEVVPGDFRTIAGLDLWSATTTAGQTPHSINAFGEIVYQASFTDGSSAILVSDAVSNRSIRPGDANLNGKVTGGDYTIWAGNFQKNGVGWSGGDFNRDGRATGLDYTIWAANFTPGGAAALPIPEPTTGWLALTAGLCGILMCRRSARPRRS